jgi:putrescine---pyruvate transaminase
MTTSRIWSPFANLPADRTDTETVTIVRGEGAWVHDAAGNRYLDGIAGLWYTLIGHGRAEMAAAIAEQVATLAAFKTHGEYDNPPVRALADELAAIFPIDDPLVFFTSGGGDAIETAAKMARAYWDLQGAPDKKLILSREGAYHGMNGFGTRMAGIDALRAGSEDGYPADVVPANNLEALGARIERIGPEHLAAFVAEPVIGAGGIVPPAPGYLEGAQRLCRDNDLLFVSDEVVTGFGRLGSWSGAEHFGLEPDLCVVAKGITSGYVPLGGVLASRRSGAPSRRPGPCSATATPTPATPPPARRRSPTSPSSAGSDCPSTRPSSPPVSPRRWTRSLPRCRWSPRFERSA